MIVSVSISEHKIVEISRELLRAALGENLHNICCYR